MTRVAGSYQSIVRGVSEQVPQDRRPGQHYEQINMISDPVRGLCRRHGSLNQAETQVANGSWTSGAGYQHVVDDTARHKCFPFQCNGKDYDLIYRTREHTGQNVNLFALCYNKTDKKFIPVQADTGNALVNDLRQGGVSAMVNIGKYLFIAPNIGTSSSTNVDAWANTKPLMVAWVRGGAYSRKYKIKLVKASGATTTVEYTTPTSSYQPLLDTSDILFSDPEYTKKVNDRVNAYNGEVTKWIGTAAAAIVPRAIAIQLEAAVNALAITGLAVGLIDSTVVFNTSAMADPFIEISCEDGGDGSLFRGVGGEVASADQVSLIHYPGKIVRVRPKKNDGTDVYYLKAEAKTAYTPGDWVEVTWREASGYTSTPTGLYAMATVASLSGVETLCIGGSNTSLASITGGTHPGVSASGSGDRTSNPLPTFVGRRITYMGLFQDRMLIAAGAVIFMSRTGDYQNFFRASVLSLEADDPVEMFALGAEDDIIRAATTYDRNMLLFGERKQYTISGRQPITPQNASVVVQSGHEDAVDSFPVNSGNFVFYNKVRNGIASAHQVQIGQLADTPESYEVSKQLDTYLKGTPVEQLAVTAPNVLFMRTETQRDRMYVYTYLDTAAGSERLFDSWSSWITGPQVGILCGISQHDGDVLAYYLRVGRSATDSEVWVYAACDKFVLTTGLSDKPYMDSLRTWATHLAAGSSLSAAATTTNVSLALDNTVPEFLLGTNYANKATFLADYPDTTHLWVGWNFSASVTPTNPYILDRNGKAIITGRLTMTKAVVSIADSSGMTASIAGRFGNSTPVDFTGRLVGGLENLVGRVPVVTTSVSVPLGREVRDFKYTLSARLWHPLTITAVEWSGQFFNNVQRI